MARADWTYSPYTVALLYTLKYNPDFAKYLIHLGIISENIINTKFTFIGISKSFFKRMF